LESSPQRVSTCRQYEAVRFLFLPSSLLTRFVLFVSTLKKPREQGVPTMSEQCAAPASATQEKTFSSYNKEQGNAYAQFRPDYHPSLYKTVLDQHTASGGQRHTLIDLGCGPGNVARSLGLHFAHAIGLDPSDGMIATARSLGGTTSTSEPIRYEVSTAEDIGANASPPIPDNSVDLITAANSAHWFDMSRFWPSAARVLKPGGSVAIWTSGGNRIHPSVPNAAAMQVEVDQIEEEYLRPYFEPGNLLTRGRYADLPLPWTLDPPVAGFDKSDFFRKNWDLAEKFFVTQPDVPLDMFEKVIGTMSPVTRWREANPDAAGTEKDVVKVYRRAIERHLHAAGVEEGKETVRGAMLGVVLVVKKKN
jgi:SAM-dependent methyltransferase